MDSELVYRNASNGTVDKGHRRVQDPNCEPNVSNSNDGPRKFRFTNLDCRTITSPSVWPRMKQSLESEERFQSPESAFREHYGYSSP